MFVAWWKFNQVMEIEQTSRQQHTVCNNIMQKIFSPTPNIALKSGSLNLNGIFDTWRRFGWFLASEIMEDEVFVAIEELLDVVIAVSVCDTCVPDDDVVVTDWDEVLASILALDKFVSVVASALWNSWEK